MYITRRAQSRIDQATLENVMGELKERAQCSHPPTHWHAGTCHLPWRGPSVFLMPFLERVARLYFTARIERAHSYRARSASKKGTWPLSPSPFSASCCAACAVSGPMIGYRHCIWSGGTGCGRRTGRRIYRSGSAGREQRRPSFNHVACRVGDTAPPAGCTLRSAPGVGNSCHLFVLRHFSGQLLTDVDGGTAGPPAASDAGESTAGERDYRPALGLGRKDHRQSHNRRTSGAAGYALRPSDEVREFGRQVVVPPAACCPQTCLSAVMVHTT